MKAISLWQPWASLWLSPRKVHETRHWSTSHRGPLLVHAAKRAIDVVTDDDDVLHAICVAEFGADYVKSLPRGGLLGIVHMTSCRPTALMPIGHQSSDDYQCGDFGQERFAWGRDAYRKFAQMIPYRGSQGFFEVPESLLPEFPTVASS